jgi:hypothetical protein
MLLKFLAQDPVYSIVKSCIVSPEELYGPGSGLTLISIEMVSTPHHQKP